MKFDPKKTICRELWGYPVIELTRPRIRTCCRRGGKIVSAEELDALGTDVFLNLPETVEDRAALMNGEKVDGCKVCWDMEDKGLRSWRLGHLDWQYHFNKLGPLQPPELFRPFDKLIRLSSTPEILQSAEPNKLDISLGTYCDLKCLYCNSDYSTSWEAETKKFGAMFEDPAMAQPFSAPATNSLTLPGYYEKFIEWFDTVYIHLERIALMGGEPTYSPLFEKLTDHIAGRLQLRASANAAISIVTNLNWQQRVLDHVISLRERLPRSVGLILEVSMESYGTRAEYIRNGVSWEKFFSNFQKLSLIEGIEIKLLPTMNALCLSSFLDYLKLIREVELLRGRDFEVIANAVTYPKWLSFEILDETSAPAVDAITNWIQNTYPGEALEKKRFLLDTLSNIRRELRPEHSRQSVSYFYRWITEVDKRRSQSFVDVFPEYRELYETGKRYQDDRSIVIDLEYLKL